MRPGFLSGVGVGVEVDHGEKNRSGGQKKKRLKAVHQESLAFELQLLLEPLLFLFEYFPYFLETPSFLQGQDRRSSL